MRILKQPKTIIPRRPKRSERPLLSRDLKKKKKIFLSNILSNTSTQKFPYADAVFVQTQKDNIVVDTLETLRFVAFTSPSLTGSIAAKKKKKTFFRTSSDSARPHTRIIIFSAQKFCFAGSKTTAFTVYVRTGIFIIRYYIKI